MNLEKISSISVCVLTFEFCSVCYKDCISTFVCIYFMSLPWPYRLLCAPVLGRRVGRTQMEESKTLGCGSLNVYEQIQKNTME